MVPAEADGERLGGDEIPFFCLWRSNELFFDRVDHVLLNKCSYRHNQNWSIDDPLHQCLHEDVRSWPVLEALVACLVPDATVDHVCEYTLHVREE